MPIKKVLGPRILIKPEMTGEVTEGGVVLPDFLRNCTDQAEVVQTGRGHRMKDGSIMPVSVKQGDRIMYGKGAGTPVEVDGEKLIIITDDQVIAVIKKGGATC
jgi:chaperonin GroES